MQLPKQQAEQGSAWCRFRRNFRDTHWVQTPVVHWGQTTQTIITQEYLAGTKISDVATLRAAGVLCC